MGSLEGIPVLELDEIYVRCDSKTGGRGLRRRTLKKIYENPAQATDMIRRLEQHFVCIFWLRVVGKLRGICFQILHETWCHY